VTIGRDHRPLREIVTDELRDMILRGDLMPGDRLHEKKIADSLGVSRNPVREAIRALEVTGLIEVTPRIGASVTKYDVNDLCQLLDVQSQLEAFAAELAASNHIPEDLTEIDRCIAMGRAASAANDQVLAAKFHRDLHLAVERSSGNGHIQRVVGPLRSSTVLAFSVLADRRWMLSWDEHQEIRDAIASGDATVARESVLSHVQSVITELATAATTEGVE